MSLTEKQQERYSRHLLLKAIGVDGQKKLLDYCIQHRKAEKMQDEQSKKGNCEENRSMFLEQIYFYEEQLKNAHSLPESSPKSSWYVKDAYTM